MYVRVEGQRVTISSDMAAAAAARIQRGNSFSPQAAVKPKCAFMYEAALGNSLTKFQRLEAHCVIYRIGIKRYLRNVNIGMAFALLWLSRTRNYDLQSLRGTLNVGRCLWDFQHKVSKNRKLGKIVRYIPSVILLPGCV